MKSAKKGTRSVLGWGLILTGIVFLANPYFSLVDILPDALGYFLILRGLRESIWVIPSFGEAAKKIKILIGISFVRMAAFPMIASMPQSESPTMSLVAVCCLVLAEGYIGWQMITEIFRGIQYTTLPFAPQLDRDLPMLRLLTRLLLCYRLVGNLLPELAVLGVTEEGFVGSVTENETQIWLQLRNVLTVLFFVLVLIGSVCFIAAWSGWLKRIRRHREYLLALEAELRDHPEPRGRRICRTAESGCLLLCIGGLLLWSVRMDGYVLMPTFLGICLIGLSCGSFAYGEPSFRRERPLWLAVSSVSLFTWISQNAFAERYYVTGSARGAETWFYINIALSFLCGIAVFLILLCLALRLRVYVDSNCFAIVDRELTRTAIEVENRKQKLKMRILLVALTALLPAVCEGIEAGMLFAPEIDFSVFGATKTVSFWGIFVLIRLAWAVFAVDTALRLKARTKERYAEAG